MRFGACRCLDPQDRTRDDELEYLAGVEVTGEVDISAGMVRWEIPAIRCARFTHRGPVTTFSETLSYVYGSWFPRSSYEPSMAYELERYDERFKLDAPDSEWDYFVGLETPA
ncbi:MAG: GyrI-like domain-containing protein [Candidatus Synoicihabitans palmerolidicus]|nr:GyrI-like domain-containing protein [Candidatus Synoicihabitans palmerolidicus]